MRQEDKNMELIALFVILSFGLIVAGIISTIVGIANDLR